MRVKEEYPWILTLSAVFAAAWFLPIQSQRFISALHESLALVKWYAQEHVILCLVPAFFIAGSIGIFFTEGNIMKYLGAKANKVVAYGVASVSGTLLAVCSCTVLPLFAGIYKMGAGIGPATAFLYSGPAINALAIIITARILGVGLGVARAVGAIVFSIVIGLAMELIFKDEEKPKIKMAQMPSSAKKGRLWETALLVGSMILILIFANWANPGSQRGFFHTVYNIKWWLTAGAALIFSLLMIIVLNIKWYKVAAAVSVPLFLSLIFPNMPVLVFGIASLSLAVLLNYEKGEGEEWLDSSFGFAKQIFPLLFVGILVAGFLLGSPKGGGVIPAGWISYLVGGNSLFSNFFASITGAFMYFATLTEIPILKGLMGNGMGKGPALALLLAGPALSLPNMLVIKSVMGTKKTVVFVVLVVVLSTFTGYIYGMTPW
jgi:uncharacterized protein